MLVNWREAVWEHGVEGGMAIRMTWLPHDASTRGGYMMRPLDEAT